MLERNFSLSQRMTQELGCAIVRGDYSSTDGLPTEAELCERFGVSRTAVREAVKMLSAKGLISSRPRQGIRILPEEEWNIFDSDILQWSLEGNPSLRVLREFMQMRIAIEPEAASLGAKLRVPKRIDAIADALDRMARAKDNENEALKADIDFHVSILYSSENRFYIHMRDFIRTALNVSIRHTVVLKADNEAVIEDHTEILNAIRAGDATAAHKAMYLLIEETIGFIELKLKQSS